MELPCQCLSSPPSMHPSVVLSILSSAPLRFTEQRIEVEQDDEEEEQGEKAGGWRGGECKEEMKKQQGRGGASPVKGHCVLQLDEQALRGTNKILTAGPSLWLPPHLTLYFVNGQLAASRLQFSPQ